MPSDAHSNMQKGSNELKPLLSKKEPELKDWENSPSARIENDKACFKENSKGVVQQLFDREISVGRNHRSNQPPHQKHCQFVLKRTELRPNGERLLDLDSTGLDHRTS